MMAVRRGVVVLMVVVGVAWATSAMAAEGATEKTFAPGQRVRMELSAGSYTIRAGRDDRIVLRYKDNPNGSRADIAGVARMP